MINVTIDTFQSDVVEASNHTAVLLDFWAPWCGPCKSLTPILEKLELDYGGAFTLAKVNSDEQQQIAAAFQIRSIPTVVLFINGQPVDGFSGALPEGQIKTILDKHIQAKQALAPDLVELDLARTAHAQGDIDGAIKHLRAAILLNDQLVEARFELIDLLTQSNPTAALIEFNKINATVLDDHQTHIYNSLHALVEQQLQAFNAGLETVEMKALLEKISTSPNNLEARLELALMYKEKNAFEPAIEQLLYIVAANRTFKDDTPRKTMLEIFNLATDTPDLVRTWRQKLSRLLN